MPSSQGSHSADEVLRAAARAGRPLDVRARARGSAWLLLAAVAVVLGAAGWIAALHVASGREQRRADALIELDRKLDDLQLLHWRGVAGDLDPQRSLVQETLRWRV